MRKERHQKIFTEKFPISQKKTQTTDFMRSVYDNAKKQFGTNRIDYKQLKTIIAQLNMYMGTFFVDAEDYDLNRILNFNLEDIYLDTVELEGKKYYRVYVNEVTDKYALVSLVYNDAWTPIIVDEIDYRSLYLEGNILKSMI